MLFFSSARSVRISSSGLSSTRRIVLLFIVRFSSPFAFSCRVPAGIKAATTAAHLHATSALQRSRLGTSPGNQCVWNGPAHETLTPNVHPSRQRQRQECLRNLRVELRPRPGTNPLACFIEGQGSLIRPVGRHCIQCIGNRK